MQERDLKSLAFLQVLWKSVKNAVPSAGAEDQLQFQPQEILCGRGTPQRKPTLTAELCQTWERLKAEPCLEQDNMDRRCKNHNEYFYLFFYITLQTTSVSPSGWSQHSMLRACRYFLFPSQNTKKPPHENEESSIYPGTDTCSFSAVVETCQKDAVQPNWGQFI